MLGIKIHLMMLSRLPLQIPWTTNQQDMRKRAIVEMLPRRSRRRRKKLPWPGQMFLLEMVARCPTSLRTQTHLTTHLRANEAMARVARKAIPLLTQMKCKSRSGKWSSIFYSTRRLIQFGYCRLPDTNQSPSETPPDKSVDVADKGSATNGTQQGSAPSQPNPQLSNNPLRSLGDALSEIRQRFDEILDSQDLPGSPREYQNDTAEASQVEYLRPEDVDHGVEALGPAGEEQVAKLNDLKLID